MHAFCTVFTTQNGYTSVARFYWPFQECS